MAKSSAICCEMTSGGALTIRMPNSGETRPIWYPSPRRAASPQMTGLRKGGGVKEGALHGRMLREQRSDSPLRMPVVAYRMRLPWNARYQDRRNKVAPRRGRAAHKAYPVILSRVFGVRGDMQARIVSAIMCTATFVVLDMVPTVKSKAFPSQTTFWEGTGRLGICPSGKNFLPSGSGSGGSGSQGWPITTNFVKTTTTTSYDDEGVKTKFTM